MGPMVGEYLYNNINKKGIYVYGNLKNNITYQNIDIILNKINKHLNNSYIIVIDSALSSKENIGKIIINKNKMIIGSALNKLNYEIGDLSIKGVVGENKNSSVKNFNELNNVSINLIKNLSRQISNKIIQTLNV